MAYLRLISMNIPNTELFAVLQERACLFPPRLHAFGCRGDRGLIQKWAQDWS